MSITKTYTSVRAMSNPTCEIGSHLTTWAEQSGGETFNVVYNGHVYQNRYWVERWHIPGPGDESTVASPHNAWQWIREMDPSESSLDCPATSIEELEKITDDGPTGILKTDTITNDTYGQPDVSFNPDGSGGGVNNLSYTASRVCNDMYNRYDPDPNRNDPDPKPSDPATRRPKVCAYVTDWCQFDGRLDFPLDDTENLTLADYGRGFDLAKIPPTAYDKLIFSFLGVAGDELFPGGKVADVFNGWNDQVPFTEKIKVGHIVPVDPYGDLGSSRNVGGGPAHTEISNANFLTYYNQEAASGLLGGLRDLKDQARREGHHLELALSIGGWSLSSYFSHMAHNDDVRAEFVASVVDFFKRFPMFTGVDIDWEYPGGGGLYPQDAGATYQTYQNDDGIYYTKVIEDLRLALDTNFQGSNRKEISVACSAVIAKMEKSNLKDLSDAGVDNIYLMSYDLFGTPWASHIGHHTNLYSPEGTLANTEEDLSADLAITYLLGLGIPASKINLGYANYGRSCTGANLIDRKYDNGNPTDGSNISVGTFEAGAPEFFDIVNNYLDLEYQLALGNNDFVLMTDTTVNADFLYNNTTSSPAIRDHFISLDTPRTVKLKAEYAMEKGLGAVFSWSGDQDCGLLANAAREGAGYLVSSEADEKIDMGPLYNPGVPIELQPVTLLPDYVQPAVQAASKPKAAPKPKAAAKATCNKK
ncbi:glycosyl hydrolase family 18 protein [Shewanella sp. YLB-07]|uniref:glycosyl hydrolase family 18 protein n=1 Tax=Shewanella sp. YLB-07 TaxID=2601268 RepID=UPI00128C570E|nr:glycosyl hydrolase family 18 protein [Shewanella sp. YLB-07]MPY26927.1 chitinase [Shewanella sp. YLB-07]